VALDDLIARARLESGLRNNAYYDDAAIVRYLDAGGAELADIFTNANQHYVISTFDFATTGPSSAVVTLPADFQQGHSLEAYPDVPGQTRTIRYLPNWLNRNAFVGSVFPFSPGGYYPVYTFLDNKLRFYPPQAVPAAPFRLYYTPQWTSFQSLVTRAITLTTGDGVSDHGLGTWLIQAGAFTSLDLGGSFTVTGDPVLNGTYLIGEVNSATIVTATPHTAGDTDLTIPGAAMSLTRPYSSVSLPAVMAPWSEYLVVYAAIAINTDRQRGTGELERKLAALKVRIASTIGQRQEEPQQPPLTRDAWGDGWGGGGWY